MAEKGQAATTGDPVETDRERVRRIMLDPLVGAGMRKQKRMSAGDHEAMLDRLERRLGYLSDACLEALADTVRRNAVGADRNVWPAEVSVMNWAAALEPPPDRDSKLVTTYLASAAGRRAWEEGPEVAVALRRHLKREGRPPHAYDWKLIRERAAEWAGWARHAEQLEAEGGLAGDQATRLGDWRRTVERVRGLVFGEVVA